MATLLIKCCNIILTMQKYVAGCQTSFKGALETFRKSASLSKQVFGVLGEIYSVHIISLQPCCGWYGYLCVCERQGSRQECSCPACVWYLLAWHRARRALHCRFPQMPGEPGGEQASALPMLSGKHATSVSSNYKEKMNHIS